MKQGGCFLIILCLFSGLFSQGGYGTIRVQRPGEDSAVGMIAPVSLEKGLKVRTTTSISDKFELKKLVVERTFYNNAGYLTDIRDYYKNTLTKFEYDSLGRLVSQELSNTVMDQLIYVDVFSYPSSGQMLQLRITIDALKVDAKPDTVFRSLSLFDEKGNKLEEKYWEKKGYERTLFWYDSLGRKAKELVFIPGVADSILRSVKYSYSADKTEVVTEEPRIKAGKVTLKTRKMVYHYDASGRLEEEETYMNTTLTVRKTYTLNDDGKPIEMRSFETGTAGVNYSHHLYDYSYY